jgi:serine/threonine-protein kinase
VYKIVHEEAAEVNRLNGTLTPQIHEVLRRGLAKKAEDRYPSCSNFVGALELACAESRGWKTLTAGGAAAMPTMGVPRTAKLETAPLPMLETSEQSRAVRSSFLGPLLMSLFVVLAVAGVIVWQAGLLPAGLIPPGLFGHGHENNQAAATPQTPPTPEPPPPAPELKPAGQQSDAPPADTPPQVAGSTESQAPAQPATSAPVDTAPAKPSPFEPSAKAPSQPTEIVKVPSPRDQDVWVTTNPPGAKAVLDDNFSQSCQTPCMLHGAGGIHRLSISQAGFESESREIHIGDSAIDVPPISLRRPSGTLMVTTSPTGASVRINGKLVPQTTPAQITLPPGTYSVTVEKGGRSQTQRIDLPEDTIYIRIPLEQ